MKAHKTSHFLLVLLLLTVTLHAWKMEADKITVQKTTGDIVTHIDFRQEYGTPPLVFTLGTTQGSNPATLRVVNVTTTGFDIYTIEPQGENGPHAKMTNVPYIAIEEGTHILPDGTKIVANTILTQKYQAKGDNASSWENIGLNGFNTNPTVLTEIQTKNNERTDENVPDSVSKPWLTVAVDNISSNSFDIALERSETTDGSITQQEKIAYLVIDSGLSGDHYFADSQQRKIQYETILTNNEINGWDDGGVKVDFSGNYSKAIVVAKKSSHNESDGGWFRRKKLENDGITLVVDEDRVDPERNHALEKASVLLFSKSFHTEFISDPGTRMVINEVMYAQTQGGTDNDEFVELYVAHGGDIKGFVLSDQDTHYYRFPSCQVNQGDYVIHHTGGDPVNNSCSGNVKHFYQGSNPYWNNGSNASSDNDDVLLILPDDDVTTSTHSNANTRKVFNGRPIDYMAYGKNGTGGNIDAIPTSVHNNKVSFDYGKGSELKGAAAGQSISLTPNGNDSDKAACWELTTSGNASDNSCDNYLPTRDTEPNASLTYSMGESNNAMPDMHITKTSIVISDPVNNTTSPKRIPGAIIRYCFTVKNTGDGSADNAAIHDTLNGDNKDKLTHRQSGKATIVTNTNDCTESDCKGIADTSGSYNAGTKKVDIDLTTPFPKDNHQCAYIEMEIK